MNIFKERRHFKHIILNNPQAIHKMQHLCLSASGAVHHTVYLIPHLCKNSLCHRKICSCWGEHQLPESKTRNRILLIQPLCAAIYQRVIYTVVEGLRITFSYIFCKDIVPCRGKSVAAHSSVVESLVGSLSA